jgi:hypothetical protein
LKSWWLCIVPAVNSVFRGWQDVLLSAAGLGELPYEGKAEELARCCAMYYRRKLSKDMVLAQLPDIAVLL